MTLWMGQDGFDYSFQGDYARMWDDTVAAIAEVADHNPAHRHRHRIQAERAARLCADAGHGDDAAGAGGGGPREHRRHARLLPMCCSRARCRPRPRMLVARHSRILGVHLNDGYGKRDDGLMAGPCIRCRRWSCSWSWPASGYDGVIYFDTFPDHSAASTRWRRRGRTCGWRTGCAPCARRGWLADAAPLKAAHRGAGCDAAAKRIVAAALYEEPEVFVVGVAPPRRGGGSRRICRALDETVAGSGVRLPRSAARAAIRRWRRRGWARGSPWRGAWGATGSGR